MNRFRVLKTAVRRIDDIYDYSLKKWGKPQADLYVRGLFGHFQKLADKSVPWQRIPKAYGVDGYSSPYQKHFVYFRVLSQDDGACEIGIATVLHRSMDRQRRLQEDVKA